MKPNCELWVWASQKEYCFKHYGADELLSLYHNLNKLKALSREIKSTTDSWLTISRKKLIWRDLYDEFTELSSLTRILGITYLIREVFITFIDKFFYTYPQFWEDDLENIPITNPIKKSILSEYGPDNLIVDFFLKTFTESDYYTFDLHLSDNPKTDQYGNVHNDEIFLDDFLYELLSTFKNTHYSEYTFIEKIKKKVYSEENKKYIPPTHSSFAIEINFIDNIFSQNPDSQDEKIESSSLFYFKDIEYQVLPCYLPDDYNPEVLQYKTSYLCQILYLLINKLKTTDLKYTICLECGNYFLKIYRSKYCSDTCGNKAKHHHYMRKGFNNDYHRLRKRFYQLHYQATRNKLDDDSYDSFYTDYMDDLHKIMHDCDNIEEFCAQGEECYKYYKEQYKLSARIKSEKE